MVLNVQHKKRRRGGILKVSPYDYFSFFMSVEMKELEPEHYFLVFRKPVIKGLWPVGLSRPLLLYCCMDSLLSEFKRSNYIF
jgi:hypothetical protein